MFLLFEVMDKEPSLPFIWGYFGVIGIAGFFLVRKHPAFLLLLVPLWLLESVLHISELNDPYVGPNIIREAGYSYVVQSYVAIVIGASLPILGFVAWVRRKMQAKSKEVYTKE